MNLLIDADLINPPTLTASFRDLTFFAHNYEPHYDVLIVCEWNSRDIYYRFLKNYVGALDYIADFVRLHQEHGLLVSNNVLTLPNYLVDRITPKNLPSVLNRIGFHW